MKDTESPGGTPITLVSADSHVGLPPKEYKKYFEAEHHAAVDAYVDDHRFYHAAFRKLGYPFSTTELEVADTRGAISAGGIVGFFDPVRRLEIVQEEGVVAEVLHPAGPISAAPFCDQGTRRVPDELRAAGTRAYNRFLEEFCSTDRRRLLGVALTYPYPDMEAAAWTVRWARDAGMAAVFPARFAGAAGDLPPLHDRSWDPFWAALHDTGLPVHIHAGHGAPQGRFIEMVEQLLDRCEETGSAAAFADLFDGPPVERRPLWQLMWGGVFDRFPNLRVVFTEIRGDWVPATLTYLDLRYEQTGRPMRLSPSEYWRRHCAIGASFMRRSDLAARNAIGADRVMFGTDYPHTEGTWPNTMDYLRLVLDDVDESEARRILGLNAIETYGLDRTYLDSLAVGLGPRPHDLLGRAGDVDRRLVDFFAHFNGLHKTGNEALDFVAASLDEDLATIGAARPVLSAS